MSDIVKSDDESFTINYWLSPCNGDLLDTYAEYRGISHEQFVVEAVRFELLRRALRSNEVVLQARRQDDQFKVRSFGVVSERFRHHVTAAEDNYRLKYPLQMDRESMLVLTHGAAYAQENQLPVTDREVRWGTIAPLVAEVTGRALHRYFERLDAEHAGWQLETSASFDTELVMVLESQPQPGRALRAE